MKTKNVNSGSFIVSTRKPEILQAFLGSCVGVTICDRQSQVGGLIHLLLPEPPSADFSWKPEVSALTGLPMFLERLANVGAKANRMEACITGGALIGPLSENDLLMDIGGRTAEIAMRIMEEEGIPVIQRETGGYLSCRLSLNLTTWESNIDQVVMPPPIMPESYFPMPGPSELDQMIERIKPIPQVALRIIRMIGNDDISFHDIAREIIKDQVLSARILKLCNSVSFGTRNRVDSIEKALMRIGQKSLLPLALSISIQGFLAEVNFGYSLCMGGLFNHSVLTANISRKLAEATRKTPADLAYTAGLLHDIGKVVLDQYMNAAYPLFYRRIQCDDAELEVVEKELFGMAHTEAGHRLAVRWEMPESITAAILHHCCPEKAEVHQELVQLVYLADLIGARLLVGQHMETTNAAHLLSSIRALELDVSLLPEIIAEAHLPSILAEMGLTPPAS